MEHIKPKGKSIEDIKSKLPWNYKHKPGTIILIDDNDNPILHDNGDGTVSGMDIKLLNTNKLK